MAVQNDLTPYTGNVPVGVNPYAKGQGEGREITYGEEYRGYKADMSMAQYNAQMAEAQLLKQRQWSLEDRDYNSPAELRKRLEEAGYNPALMSGAIQTANAPVRGAQTSSPGGSAGTGSGGSRAAIGNMLQAGSNLIETLLARKQAQAIDSQIGLNQSQSIKALSESNLSGTQKKQIDSLLPYSVQSLKMDIQNKEMDVGLKEQQLNEVVPQQIANMQKQVQLMDKQVAEIQNNMNLKNKLQPYEIKNLQSLTSKALSEVANNKKLYYNLGLQGQETEMDIKNKIQDYAMKQIIVEVKNDTKLAQKMQEITAIIKGLFSYSGSSVNVNSGK